MEPLALAEEAGETLMGPTLRTVLLLLLYPVLIAGVQFSWNTPQRVVTWGTASLVGIAVFIVVFVQSPATSTCWKWPPELRVRSLHMLAALSSQRSSFW
jgi:hypothetical protein